MDLALRALKDMKSKEQIDDQSLVEDIRLLGRLLGDVIREQEGSEAYLLIEEIRRLSVSFRLRSDIDADRSLTDLLKKLSDDEALRVIRAFTYFSHLANLAEDRHQIRLHQQGEQECEPREGGLVVALQRLREAGFSSEDVVAMLEGSHVSPVLTAHPTEVQRRSVLDAERSIAELLGERWHLSGRAQTDNEKKIRARITQLWQTRLLRFSKLTVADEIDNVLSYYQSTFLSQIPQLYRDLEEGLAWSESVASFLRMGQWIGGDRDGNLCRNKVVSTFQARPLIRRSCFDLLARNPLVKGQPISACLLSSDVSIMQLLLSPVGLLLRWGESYSSKPLRPSSAIRCLHPTQVFTYEGRPIVQVNTKAWRAALKRAGIEDFRWHDLRHTFATWHRQAGTPTHELQRLGGWRTLEMVERYAHVAPEGLQVAASRLDNVLAGTF